MRTTIKTIMAIAALAAGSAQADWTERLFNLPEVKEFMASKAGRTLGIWEQDGYLGVIAMRFPMPKNARTMSASIYDAQTYILYAMEFGQNRCGVGEIVKIWEKMAVSKLRKGETLAEFFERRIRRTALYISFLVNCIVEDSPSTVKS